MCVTVFASFTYLLTFGRRGVRLFVHASSADLRHRSAEKARGHYRAGPFHLPNCVEFCLRRRRERAPHHGGRGPDALPLARVPFAPEVRAVGVG